MRHMRFTFIIIAGAALSLAAYYLVREYGDDAMPVPDVQNVLPLQEGLPSRVEKKRQAIARAALTRDYEAFSSLMREEEFKYSFGGGYEGGFIQFLKDADERSGKSTFDTMLALLRLSYGTQLAYYVWPAVFTKSSEEWTEDDLFQLRQIATEEEIEGYRRFGAYIGYRIGIRDDGTWVYYIAGD